MSGECRCPQRPETLDPTGVRGGGAVQCGLWKGNSDLCKMGSVVSAVLVS